MPEIEIEIDSMDRRGVGVAQFNGRRVAVPYSIPGERVRVELGGDAEHPVSIERKSPHRIQPLCHYFGRCGGCLLQHIDQEFYRKWKSCLVEEAFASQGLKTSIMDIIDAHGQGRRRVSLHVRRDGGRVTAGFMGWRSHRLQDIDSCPILVPALNGATTIARAIGQNLGNCDVALTATDGGVDASIKIERSAANSLAPKLAALAVEFDLARISVNGEIFTVRNSPSVTMGRAVVVLPPFSFLQATESGEKILAGLVASAVVGATSVADLFCGCGPFALRLAALTRVSAIDSDRHAVVALHEATRRTKGLKPIDVIRRDLCKEPLVASELSDFDAVIFDPPRAGAEAQARQLARSRVKTIVAVSCDAATLARDAAILVSAGYQMERVTPVDQFAWSPHIEMVAVLRKS